MADSEVKIDLELVSDSWLVKRNEVKSLLFKIYCFLTLGIIYILHHYIGFMWSY